MRRRLSILFLAVAAVLVGFLLLKSITPSGRLRLPAGTKTPQISLGYTHGLLIAPDGTLWTWGAEDLGWPVLGLGQTNGVPAFSPLLRRISADTNWVQVSAGQDHNLALKSDGTIWSWGANYRGQLGASRVTMLQRSGLMPSAQGTNWAQIEAGNVCSFALKTDGSLWAWGVNNFSRLGIGNAIDSPVPVQVGSSTKWVKVRAGGVNAAGIQSDGSLWIWGGSLQFGNTGPSTFSNLAVPTRMTSETNWVDVSVDYNLWLAVKADGTLWAFGQRAHAYTGALPTSFAIPKRIGTNTDWISVSASRYGQLLRRSDGSFCFMTVTNLNPGSVTFQDLNLPAIAVAADTGGGAVAAVTRDGEVWGWGAILGKQTSKDRLLQSIARLGARVSWLRDLGDHSEKIHRNEPWILRNTAPDDPSAK